MPRLFASCPRYGLLCLDTDSGQMQRIHPSLHDVHAGIHGQKHYALWVYGGRKIALIDYNGQILSCLHIPDLVTEDWHGIYTDREHTWLCNPIAGVMIKLDADFQLVERAYTFEGARGFVDACHLNDVWVDDGHVYSTMFVDSPTLAYKPEEEAWRNLIHSGTLFEWIDGKPQDMLNGMDFPHSPRIYGDKGIVCNSLHGEVWHLLKSNGEWGVAFTTWIGNGFTRGIIRYGNGYFIGLSCYRKSHEKYATIAYMDDDGLVKRRWLIPCREIYDLHIMEPK